MKWDFISQPFAVAAAMWSRTGVILFLYTCFAQNRKSLRIVVIVCLVVQFVANLFTILQIFLQCGPNPYRLVNRAAYFHYMWDPLPTDGSAVCQAPTVQATVGYVQGGTSDMHHLPVSKTNIGSSEYSRRLYLDIPRRLRAMAIHVSRKHRRSPRVGFGEIQETRQPYPQSTSLADCPLVWTAASFRSCFDCQDLCKRR